MTVSLPGSDGTHHHHRQWWKEATFYQIYPASFKDTTGSGMGDLKGILSKLDYLKDLGVDCIWISPFYDSPQFDMGYDISNYEDVWPEYGTLADIQAIIDGCHERGMKIIGDLIINHTSHLHKWFQESSSSKDNPKRNWYIWRPPKYDKDGNRQPPNNWRGNFNGSVWTWHEETQEYYMHLFAPQQPDLNFENEECRQAIWKSAVLFWLERGLDGFRVDTVNMYSKGSFDDVEVVDPRDPWQPAHHVYCNGPRMHEYLRELDDIALSKYNAVTVGELPNTPDPAHVRRYISASDRQLSMVFQFDIVDIDIGSNQKFEIQPWKLKKFKDIVSKWQSFIEGTDSWTTVFFENHDQPRSISRYADDSPEHRVASGKMLSLMACTMTGSLFIYQGQEIGMINTPRDWPLEDYIDIEAINYSNLVQKRDGSSLDVLGQIKKALRAVGRDNARTPMQWDDSDNAGFTSGKPWHRTNDSYKTINVAAQEKDPKSVLAFWKSMIKLRKAYEDVFIYGDFKLLDYENPHTLTYLKSYHGQRALVVCNFTSDKQAFDGAQLVDGKVELLAATMDDRDEKLLAPYEARVYSVQ